MKNPFQALIRFKKYIFLVQIFLFSYFRTIAAKSKLICSAGSTNDRCWCWRFSLNPPLMHHKQSLKSATESKRSRPAESKCLARSDWRVYHFRTTFSCSQFVHSSSYAFFFLSHHTVLISKAAAGQNICALLSSILVFPFCSKTSWELTSLSGTFEMTT